MHRDHRSGISHGINGCLLIEAVLLTKPEVAEGCAARVIVIVSEESCEGLRVRHV